jgi:ribosomal protein L40E
MIVCPNCNHQNPDGAVQCEACYTPLPTTTHCPNCGAVVQTDASFCGQCGFNLQVAVSPDPAMGTPPIAAPPAVSPDLGLPEPLVEPDPLIASIPPLPPEPSSAPEPVTSAPPAEAASLPATAPPVGGMTQLQQVSGRLLHLQTNRVIDLPQGLTVIHIGKPNDRIPPDIDVSGFPDSEIVSRIHADIRVEGDAYYIEDIGSSNGTYINNSPLPVGSRYRLRPGDRVALGKGDKMSFLFQM